MKLTGGCHCGAIRFRAKADPTNAGVCHCSDCQRLSGSPWRASIGVTGADFELERGEPKIYVKVAESGARRAQGFCGACGSAIYSTDADAPKTYNIRLGAVDQCADIIPQRQSWRRSALPWALDIRALPSVEADR